MSPKKVLFLSLLLPLLLGWTNVQSQDLEVAYTSAPGTGNTDTIMVYMRTTTLNTMDINAVNFSFLYDGNCAVFQGFQSIFETEWSTFLEKTSTVTGLTESYGGHTFDTRLKYGSADPGFAFTNPITIPDISQDRLLVMKVAFDGLCGELIYMENESENPVNQIASGPSFTRVPYSLVALNSAFPVEILGFQATAIDHETVQLDWETANENNNDYFEVEKSFDGVAFEILSNSRIQGAGNTTATTQYDYLDRGQMANIVYYRLRQVDFDGASTHSNIIEVHFSNLNPNFDLTVSAAPNPTTDRVTVEVDSPENSAYELKVVDMTGRILLRQEVAFGPSFTQRKEISLGEFPSGMYHLEVADLNASGKAKTIRVIKK